MRLICQKVCLLVMGSSIACRNSTVPEVRDEGLGEQISAGEQASSRYVLETIDGRPLPTYIAIIPAGVTTVFSSSVTLDKAGKAVIVEHKRSGFGGRDIESTDTSTFDYRIHDGRIEIGSFGSCATDRECAPARTGTISVAELNLVVFRINDFEIIGRYRAAGNR
jgi:hypothetical protein